MPVTVRAYEHGANTRIVREALKPLAGAADGAGALAGGAYVAVGDAIDVEDGDVYLKGHGTQVVGDKLVATQCGLVTRTDRLISVRPPKERCVGVFLAFFVGVRGCQSTTAFAAAAAASHPTHPN